MSNRFQFFKVENDYSNINYLIEGFDAECNTHSTADTECSTATPLSSSPEAMKERHQDTAALNKCKKIIRKTHLLRKVKYHYTAV